MQKKSLLRKILLIMSIFLVLTSFRLIWLSVFYQSGQPKVQNGVLDLRHYNLDKNETLTLNGEWLFTPEEFLTPNGISQQPFEIVSFPTAANDAPYEFGTFQITILLNEEMVNQEDIGIRIPSTQTASKLFVNGQVKGISGTVSDNKKMHVGQDMPYIVQTSADEERLIVQLHVSNFDTPVGIGAGKSIKFGTVNAIERENMLNQILVLSVVVILIIHSLYTILIYFFLYRHKMIFFFTVGFLLPAFDELLSYNKAILAWMHLDYDWQIKLLNLIYLGSSFFFIQFMRILLVKHRYLRLFKIIAIAYGVCAIGLLVTPVHFQSVISTIYFALYSSSFLTIIVLGLREYFEGHKRSVILVFITLSTLSGIVWGAIKGSANIEIPFYPFDYLFAFLAFACFWFYQFQSKNRRVENLAKELQAADKVKDDFLLLSSQKLSVPLGEMMTIVQAMKDQSTLTAHDEANVNYLLSIGKSMTFMLQDLLDFTRMQENTILLNKTPISLQAILVSIFDTLRFYPESSHITLASNIPKDFPKVMADEERLFQIFFNILQNAIQYTEALTVHISAQVVESKAKITITTEGYYVDGPSQQRIFSSMEKASLVQVDIALIVCKKLIEMHDGTFSIDSNISKGTVFTLTLPISSNVESEEQLSKKSHRFPLGTTDQDVQFQILAIDDDTSLQVIQSIFPEDTYAVQKATSSEDALSLLNHRKWDLIIVNSILPTSSGYELTRTIRKKYSVLELPIILMTPPKHYANVAVSFAYGANDYVSKPLNAVELFSRARALIDLKKSISEQLYMEAAWLQAQIQPHFLYNTLNTIASLSSIDSNRMNHLLHRFGEYLRLSFDVRNLQREILIEEELTIVESYLYIEKERFGDRLTVKWNIDQSVDLQTEIPPLTIQPIVENAVRHGIMRKTAGGTIQIEMMDYHDYIEVMIMDDGVGMKEDIRRGVFNEQSEIKGIGLRNTNRRLVRIYGTGLQIDAVENEGTTVSFRIPKTKGGMVE